MKIFLNVQVNCIDKLKFYTNKWTANDSWKLVENHKYIKIEGWWKAAEKGKKLTTFNLLIQKQKSNENI